MTRRPLRAVPVAAACAALVCAASACGSAADALPGADPTARFHGTVGPEFTGVSATVHYRVPEPTPGCRRRSPSSGEWLRKEARQTEGVDVAGGRFEVTVPLQWPEPSPCDFRPVEVTLAFSRGGRRGDPETSGVVRFDLGGPAPDDGRGPAFVRAPLPDSVTVRCLLVKTVRAVPVDPVHCAFLPPEDGVWGELPTYVVPALQAADVGSPALDVPVSVRLDSLYSADVGWNAHDRP